MIAYQRVVDAFRAEGLNVVEHSAGRAKAQAPGHSTADFSVTITDIGEQCLIHSHSDPTDQVLETLGLTQADLFDHEKGVDYEYPDGRTVHRSTDKKFRQSGNTKGTALYRADKIPDGETIVYLTEGEKDVHALESLGLTAVCAAMGAGKANLFDLTPLYGKRVVIVRDMDAPGAEHAKQLVELLTGKATVEVVKPKAGKDAADHVSQGYGMSDFESDDCAAHIQLMASMQQALKACEVMSAREAMAHMYKQLDSLAVADDNTDTKDWTQLLANWWDWYEEPPEPNKVVATPWDDLNDALAGGLHAGRSYLIAGRPGGGKSLGITNVARFAAMCGAKVLLYTVEMGSLEITSRVLAEGSIAEYGSITKRDIKAEDLGHIAEFADQSAGMNLKVNDNPNMTIGKIRQEARIINAREGIDVICIDYIQILKSDNPGANRQEQISQISQAVKLLSRELDCSVLTAAQLNRGNVKDNRAPTIADLRESGSLEQDADVVILLHHELVEQGPGLPPMGNGMVRFIVAKNRTGKITTVELPWRPHYAKIG